LLLEGNSIRSTERITRVHRDTICRLIVRFGDACRDFLDERMRGLTLTHLQFDEQWTYVVSVAECTFCDFAKFRRLAFYGPTEFGASRWARHAV